VRRGRKERKEQPRRTLAGNDRPKEMKVARLRTMTGMKAKDRRTHKATPMMVKEGGMA
jgi:hypothetical protein